jgi:hypothetical protein
MTTQVALSQVPTLWEANASEWPSSPLVETVNRRLARSGLSRRRVLQAAFVSACLTSLNFVAWLGKGVSPAAAYGACFSQWTGADSGCNPPYVNFSYPQGPTGCWGGQVIGVTLCNADGWHRRDQRIDGRFRYVYYRRCAGMEVCGGHPYGVKNAWQWKISGGPKVRCSDGDTAVYVDGNYSTTYLSVCAKPL